MTEPDRRSDDRDDRKRRIAMAHLGDLKEDTPATPQERGLAVCPCPGNCSLRGQCLLCTAYHARKGRLPFCENKRRR